MTNWEEHLEEALEQFQELNKEKFFIILDGRIVNIKLCEVAT